MMASSERKHRTAARGFAPSPPNVFGGEGWGEGGAFQVFRARGKLLLPSPLPQESLGEGFHFAAFECLMTASSERKTLTTSQRRALLATPAGWMACGLGSGLAPVAQGTFGSLAAILPWLALRELSLAWNLAVIVLGFALGVWACHVASRALGVDDHRALVWDEFIGQWIALLPALVAPWWAVLAGFALFRLFDVWKPWPIRVFDRRLHGGLGVMVDDVVAGVFAAVVLGLVLH